MAKEEKRSIKTDFKDILTFWRQNRIIVFGDVHLGKKMKRKEMIFIEIRRMGRQGSHSTVCLFLKCLSSTHFLFLTLKIVKKVTGFS